MKGFLTFLRKRGVLVFFAPLALVGCKLQEAEYIEPKPVALEASETTSASFVAEWTPVLGSTIYTIDVAENEDFTNFVTGYRAREVNGTTIVVSGLTVDETYYYRVRAVYDDKLSEESNTVVVSTATLPAPVASEAMDKTVFEFTASWTPIEEAVSYILEVASDPEFNEKLEDFEDREIVDTSLTVTGLDYTKTYYYRVVAKRLEKSSFHSNTVEVAPTISETCKLSELRYTGIDTDDNEVDYTLTFTYDSEGKLESYVNKYKGDAGKGTLNTYEFEYDAEGLPNNVLVYDGSGDLSARYEMVIGANGKVSQIQQYNAAGSAGPFREFAYDDDDNLIAYRNYSDNTRADVLTHEDYELDNLGSVSKARDERGGLLWKYDYDEQFNPKKLIDDNLIFFIPDEYEAFDFQVYTGLNNPISAKTSSLNEGFVYTYNNVGVATDRTGVFDIKYEFTGCDF